MYTVAVTKFYDNNTIEVELVDNSEKAREIRQAHVDNLCKLYHEVDFCVVGNEFSPYLTINSEQDGANKTWMVVKITHHGKQSKPTATLNKDKS